MERKPEPELMDEEGQARAYALADFAEPHDRFVALFRETFPKERVEGWVLDLGCGPADVTIRFARAYPACRIEGIDGAAAMLRYGEAAIAEAGLQGRIRLLHGRLPQARPSRPRYDVLISNSLLHHLADPATLWETIKQHAEPGAAVFVMDLMRPQDLETAEQLVALYAPGEPEVLRRDFHHSLLAAYRPEEVAQQLREAGLLLEVRPVSDRHLTISGRMP